MQWIHAEASSVIGARAEEIYAVIADYHTGHPAILPKAYFSSLTVEEGGQGAGTVISGSVKVFGTEYPFRQLVSEPEPGRRLVETDTETGQFTHFILEPLDGGARTRVTIRSEFPSAPGLMGWLERLTKPAVTRRIYQAELQQLAQYMQHSRTSIDSQS
jgi:hypothetical protein